MLLEEKGKILPPPILNTPSQIVSETIQSWENIISATHWDLYDNNRVDGADFYVKEKELGHIHLDGEIHLATDSALSTPLLKKNLAQKFPYAKNWVQYNIKSEKDVKQAVWLFQLNYKRICGVSMEQLVKEIDDYSIA